MICWRLMACDSPIRKSLFWNMRRLAGFLWVRFRQSPMVLWFGSFTLTSR